MTPGGVATIQQPKRWYAESAKSWNVDIEQGAKIAQAKFFYGHGVMKFTRLDNVPNQYLVSPEIASAGIERAYTSWLSPSVRKSIYGVFQRTHYVDTAAILVAQGNGDSAKLISKKPISIGGAQGYSLDFLRRNHNGVDHMRHIVLKKGNTYYEIIVVAPVSEWPSIRDSVNVSIQTLRI